MAGNDRQAVERRLVQVGGRLTRAREELAALDEQVAWFSAAADDARIKALVTESKVAQRELTEAERHAQAMARSRSDLAEHIEYLRRLQDELLELLPWSTEAPDPNIAIENERGAG